MVDRETAAWNDRDVESLLDLFHPDMVWAWPPTAYDHKTGRVGARARSFRPGTLAVDEDGDPVGRPAPDESAG